MLLILKETSKQKSVGGKYRNTFYKGIALILESSWFFFNLTVEYTRKYFFPYFYEGKKHRHFLYPQKRKKYWIDSRFEKHWFNSTLDSTRFILTDPEVDDGGSQQDPDTLQQVAHHVDEGRLHTGITVAMMVAVTLPVTLRPAGGKPVAVAVWGAGLVEDQGHSKQTKSKLFGVEHLITADQTKLNQTNQEVSCYSQDVDPHCTARRY